MFPVITLLISFLFFSSASFASFADSELPSQYNYEQQNCLNNGGHIVLVKARAPRPVIFEFCYFWAEYGGMTTRALLQGRGNSFGGPDANRAYRNSVNFDFSACQRNGGTSYNGERKLNDATASVRICGFWDGSAMDDRTLDEGVNSPWNRDLNRALGIF